MLASTFAPVVVALKGIVLAGMLWASLAVLDVRATFRHCLSAVWSTEVLLTAPQFIYGIAALLKGAQDRGDLFVPLGLDLVWSPADGPLAMLSHAVNICFVLWCVMLWRQLRRHGTGADNPWAVIFATALAGIVIILLPIFQLSN